MTALGNQNPKVIQQLTSKPTSKVAQRQPSGRLASQPASQSINRPANQRTVKKPRSLNLWEAMQKPTENHTKTMREPCGILASTMRKPYESHAKTLRKPCEHLTNTMRKPFENQRTLCETIMEATKGPCTQHSTLKNLKNIKKWPGDDQ